MSFIAEFRLLTPVLRDTRQAIPEMTFEMEDFQLLEDGRAKYVFWVDGKDNTQLDLVLDEDQTVDDFVLLTGVGDRKLYRVTFTNEAKEYLTTQIASEFDIVVLSIVGTVKGVQFRAQIPSQVALNSYRDHCKQAGIGFKLNKLYHEDNRSRIKRYNLTDRQYEALVLAYKRGYFGAERKVTLEELADEFDISRQAFAARLRRGHERLIANSLI